MVINKAKCKILYIVAINILSLAAFPLYITLPYTWKVTKLKLFIQGKGYHKCYAMVTSPGDTVRLDYTNSLLSKQCK